MRVLFISDIMGEGGRKAVKALLPRLRSENGIDLVVANVDNLSHGKGCTRKNLKEIRNAGVDAMTGGNHVFDRREMMEEIDSIDYLARGANYSGDVPGSFIVRGEADGVAWMVSTFMGQTFMGSFENPFNVFDNRIGNNFQDVPVKIVDFHAETTSEKQAFGRHLDGRVSAVIGTHTHVQTADERILPGGTGFITDAGMTGPHDSIIGMSVQSVMPRFLTGLPTRFEPARDGILFQGVQLDIDDESGKTESIQRISIPWERR